MDPETRELRVLEAEVAALQRECRMLQKSVEKTSGARKSFQKTSQTDSGKSLTDLESQLGRLRSELSFLSKLTGINIRNYSKVEDTVNTEVTEKDTKKVLQRHRLSGNCNMVTFQLEFQVLEIETEGKLSSIITDLSIIMEPTEYSELSEFASRNSLEVLECILHTLHRGHTPDLNLSSLFSRAKQKKKEICSGFSEVCIFFVEWYEYRENTFKHFKEKYPDSVYLSEGTCSHCMEIRSARQPGFELVIVWRIQIDDEGKVFPKLDLLTKVPERAMELDKNRVIETAPLSFRSLLGVLGIEAALDSLIRLFSAENN